MKTKKTTLAQLKKEIKEKEEALKRALADYQNLQKRVAEEKREFAKWANKELILKLLPVLDNLERATHFIKDKGLQIVLKEFWHVLEKEGVSRIKTKGEKFDPEYMECIETIEGKRDGYVLEETRAGYLLHGKLLRPAQVKVQKRLEKEA